MVSVVIPALIISDELYTQAKRAIESAKTKDIELIIVDNGSTIGSDYLQKVADIYIRYPTKIGFARACNAGLKLATSNYLAIQSIDVEYLVSDFSDLAEQYSHLDGIGVIFPSAQNKNQIIDETFHENSTEGSTFLLSREVYDKVKLPEGLYDERYEHGYYEDTDLWYRMDELGLKLIRSGFVLMNHLQGTTNYTLGVLEKYMEINKKKFEEKWGKEAVWRG